MSYTTVPTTPEHGPYNAVIGTDTGFEAGHIRIEPPFTPGEPLLSLAQAEGVNLGLFATTNEATLLDYFMPDAEVDSDPQENLDLMVDTVDRLLGYLGMAAPKREFTEYWNQFKG